jgi:LysM repeat protein
MIKLLFVFLAWSPASSDSLRLETVNGKQFIIHQIDAKETLYSISRRYAVPVTAILESNPESKEGLGVGKLLKVPYTPKPKKKTEGITHTVAAKETLFSIAKQYDVSMDDLKRINSLSGNDLSLGQTLVIPKKSTLVETPKLIEAKSVSGTHTVAAKETMYSIAKQYGVSVEQLKVWNSLQENELKIGQMLYLQQPKYSTTQQPTEVKQTAVIERQVVTIEKPVTETTTIKISEKVAGTDEVKESGLAELMDGTEGNRKYLALHRTAKAGSILKVRNELNNKEVFVRVTGPLLSNGINDGIVIKISKSAFDRLGAEASFKAEVTYYK